jgi:hypothetical protein
VKSSSLSIHERFEAGGNFLVDEVCQLNKRGKTGFYEDLKAGLVTIQKIGRKTVITGPVAKSYIAGQPIK